jgi:hypothetical protein
MRQLLLNISLKEQSCIFTRFLVLQTPKVRDQHQILHVGSRSSEDTVWGFWKG